MPLDEKYLSEIDFDVLNKNVDSNLFLISKHPINGFLKEHLVIEGNPEPDRSEQKLVSEYMILEGLVILKSKYFLSPTKLGFEIIRKGGWLKYLEREKDKADKIDRKLKYDLRTSKIKAKTFVPVMILGAFGGIYSIIKIVVFLLSTLSPKQPTDQNSQTELVKPNKIFQKESHILSDSLHNQDNQNIDSLSYFDQLVKGQKK